MSRYTVEITPAARKQIKPLPKHDKIRILNKIESLSEDPRPPRSKQLVGGEGLHRIRVGDYRIIYLIDDEILVVLVAKVGNRKEVYR
jgi:mRNA interferase RelE/StbE